MSAQECRFCKHWKMSNQQCHRLSDGGMVWVEIHEHPAPDVPIHTNASFGCRLFEPREVPGLTAQAKAESLRRNREISKETERCIWDGEQWTRAQHSALEQSRKEREQRREHIATEVLGRLVAAETFNGFLPPSEAALKARLMADALMAELDKA